MSAIAVNTQEGGFGSLKRLHLSPTSADLSPHNPQLVTCGTILSSSSHVENHCKQPSASRSQSYLDEVFAVEALNYRHRHWPVDRLMQDFDPDAFFD